MNSSRCILWFATCCLLLSCSQGINNDDVITIPLGASVGKDNQPIDPMMLKVVDVTRMESTDGCFLRRGRYFDIDDKSVGVYDGERILKVGIGQGKIQLNISRIGRGPGEYLGVDGCRYDHDNKWYVVTSLLDGKVIWYDELNRVMVHGILHLIGYDDHSEEDIKMMRYKENYYLELRKAMETDGK